MKTRWTILILFTCMAASLYLRVILPYHSVFIGQWIKFTSVDAYWQMMNVDKMAPDFPGYIFAVLDVPFFQWLLSGVIWLIGLGNPTQTTIDTVAAYFPPVLAALAVVPVYFIGKSLFGRLAGLVAAALVAVLPGEWLGRSMLGFTDHHVAEVLLSTTAVMFLIFSLKSQGRRRVIHGLLAALFVGIYLLTWHGGILLIVMIFGFLAVQAVLDRIHHRIATYPLVLLGIAGVAAVMLLFVTDFQFYKSLVVYLTSSATIQTTMEMRPILFPMGSFTLGAVWANLSTLVLITPVAFVLLLHAVIKRGDMDITLLLVWSLVMLVAMLAFRRFAYYFTVNAALLAGYAAWRLREAIRDRAVALMLVAVLIFLMVIPSFQYSSALARSQTFAPSDAWMESLDWIEQNTNEDDVILAWWDYGYWIERETGRKAFITPMQPAEPIATAAELFLNGSADEVAAETGASYIVIHYQDVTSKLWAIATWADFPPKNYFGNYYIREDGDFKPVRLFHPQYYLTLIVGLYNFDGEAVMPTQSTVIRHGPGNVLTQVDVVGSYSEALAKLKPGSYLVGTDPFISPVPLERLEGFELVYRSEQKINGMAEVKIFKVLRRR